ncbi:SAV_2336 N-terminal domain-related protein [Streptomyces sp. NPDC058662]|uniref:SAV_2336 N-terminal domain-related protein n=1 Tax=Streptomyces sp. NPDC058662 TaxID=3346583 RepID=UPI00364681AA
MPGPGATGGAGGSGIRELAALLREAGLDPTAGELADALWLAGRIGPGPGPGAAHAWPPGSAHGPGAGDRAPGSGPGPGAEDSAGAGEKPHSSAGTPEEAEGPVGLHAAQEPPYRAGSEAGGATVADGPGAVRPGDAAAPEGPPGERGVPVRVPGAAALPRILDIQRALRVLQRHRPPGPPTRTVLDEPATVEASARACGLIIPVLRGESRREATVRLVMDASPSMAVWQEMFEELRSVCERLGAFRDVQVHYLHRLADGTAAIGRGPAPGAGMRSGEQLRDPTGRALTMVVSDCAGPLWREGAAQRLLHRWAECTPCVVVQPLPQRLWGRSWLPTERGTLARVEGGGGKLRFRSDRPPWPGRPTGGLTVPVLPPSATALGAWARLVAGLGAGPVPAEVARVRADHPAARVPPPRAERPPRELVSRFRSSAGPRAVQLAVYLSAAPLTVPVMRLVQRTMLPDSEPSDLAEVLLSGLLRRVGPPAGQWYEFVPGVRDVLLGPLGRDEAALVLKHCSEYVLAHFGRGVRNFPALAVSQLTGVPVALPEAGPRDPVRAPAGRLPEAFAQAFAQVSAKVVRRYLPGTAAGPAPAPPPAAPPARARAAAVREARERLADGDARAVYEAVAVLRHAVAAPEAPGDQPGEAEAELAGALLRLWAEQRDPELLAEAERAVAAPALRTVAAARAVLGRVLYERALEGEPDAELLGAAEREFAAAGATGDARLRRDCAVHRARTLLHLSALHADPTPLHEARTALTPLTAAWPPQPPPEPPAPLEPLGSPQSQSPSQPPPGPPVSPPPVSPPPGGEGAERLTPEAGRAAAPAGAAAPPGEAGRSGPSSGAGPGAEAGVGVGAPPGEAGRSGPSSGAGPGAEAGVGVGAPSGEVGRSGPPSDAGPSSEAAAGAAVPRADSDPDGRRGSASAGDGPAPPDDFSGSGGSGRTRPDVPPPVSVPVGSERADNELAGERARPSDAAEESAGQESAADADADAAVAGSESAPPGAADAADPLLSRGTRETAEPVEAAPPPGAAASWVGGSVPPVAQGGAEAAPAGGTGPGAGPGAAPGYGSGSPAEPGSGDAEVQLVLGQVLVALVPHASGAGERGALAEEAAARLGAVLEVRLGGPQPASEPVARVRLELAGALRHLPGRLEEAAGQLGAALEEPGPDPELRVAALVCLARVHRARYARDADPAALEDAAEAYGRARRLIPRDAEAFAELLPEWGDVLLHRARAAPDGRRFTGAAVRVLRDSRAAVARSDPGSAHRLLRLASGLRLRHAYEGDPVDLREAEYLLELAVRQSRCPLERARAWQDHGDVQREIHGHTRAADRLDRAVDSYRRAWRSALEAGGDEHRREEDRGAALGLAARAQQSRGEVLERLARPRAALAAYRAALELWQRLGDPPSEHREAALSRVRALESSP